MNSNNSQNIFDSNTDIEKHEKMMIEDGMNAIKISECEDFIKNFNGNSFLTSNDPRINKIVNNMNYKGHSGASIALTLRKCQSLLA